MRSICLALALALILNTQCAFALTAAKSQNPVSFVDALQRNGFTATVSKNLNGDPQISTASSGFNVIISFRGCSGGQNCQYVELLSYISCEGFDAECVAEASDWQKVDHFAGANYIPDRNLIGLYYYIVPSTSGVADAMLIAAIEFFVIDVNSINVNIAARKPKS